MTQLVQRLQAFDVQLAVFKDTLCSDVALAEAKQPPDHCGHSRQAKFAQFLFKWHVESFFSGLKRMTGSALSARTDANLAKEAAFRVLAYAIYR